MVLQNKYKARASRRYQAQRGAASSSGGRGTVARGGGSRPARSVTNGHGGSDSEGEEEEEDDDDDDDDGENEGQEGGSDTDIKDAKESFTQSKDVGSTATVRGVHKGQERSKYARRKLQSNAWRFEQEDDNDDDEGQPPEPEVDLSIVFEKARISHLQDQVNSTSKSSVLSPDDEDDVDTTLSYLNSCSSDRSRRRPMSKETTTVNGAVGKSGFVAPSFETYQEAQLANRKAKERTDARMKNWTALEDDLKSKTRSGAGPGGLGGRGRGVYPDASQGEKAEKQSTIKVLEGQDFLDSVLS